MNHLITVPFHQQSLVVLEKDGKRWVALKPICEAIGIDWEGQRQRLKRDPILSSVTFTIKATGADGKQYEMLFIELDYLNGWLFRIDASRVNPQVRERVIEHQRECYKVLAAHFLSQDRLELREEKAKNAAMESAYFKRHPERFTIRFMALKGEPYWYIGRHVQRAAGTVSRAIKDMIAWKIMSQRHLDLVRTGMQALWRYRRKYENQLSFWN